MPRGAVPGAPVIDQFPVFEPDGYTKHSGLSPSDFSVSVFHNGLSEALPVAIAEIGGTGEYSATFTPPTAGFWVVEVFIEYNKDIWSVDAEASYTDMPALVSQILEVKELTKRTLGLLHENAMLDRQQYDGSGQLTYARLRVFDSAAHVPTAPGGEETTGLVYKYEIQAVYSGFNTVTKYTLKRVL